MFGARETSAAAAVPAGVWKTHIQVAILESNKPAIRTAIITALSLCVILAPVAYFWRASNAGVAEFRTDAAVLASIERRQNSIESRILSSSLATINPLSAASIASSQPTNGIPASLTSIAPPTTSIPELTSSTAQITFEEASTTSQQQQEPQQQPSTNTTLLSDLITAVSPCFLRCVGLPPSNHITVSDWNTLCQSVNATAAAAPTTSNHTTTSSNTLLKTRSVNPSAQTTLASTSTRQNYAAIVATIAANFQSMSLNAAAPPLVQSIYQAGIALLEATPTFDSPRDTVLAAAKAEQDMLCGAVTCDSTTANGVVALQAACQVILSNGTSMSPDVIQSLLQMAGFAPASNSGSRNGNNNNNGNRLPVGGVAGDTGGRGSGAWVESGAMRMLRPGWGVWVALTMGVLFLV
ncbi:hypothetical protein BJ741DRAFT_609952 [Chytriomyces cf. hyalinus JEL632]|nr:hypothetical protein BJ741DRAFT_609952 [Chytriomyces cf. hyalinus JEL632]